MIDPAESPPKPNKSKRGKSPHTSVEDYEEQLRIVTDMPAPSGRYDKSAKARSARNIGAVVEDSTPVEELKQKSKSARKKEKDKEWERKARKNREEEERRPQEKKRKEKEEEGK